MGGVTLFQPFPYLQQFNGFQLRFKGNNSLNILNFLVQDSLYHTLKVGNNLDQQLQIKEYVCELLREKKATSNNFGLQDTWDE